HHIVSDGWSREILIREVTGLYEDFDQGREARFPGLGIQYGDYAVWQRNWLQGERLEEQVKYWKDQVVEVGGGELPKERARAGVRVGRTAHGRGGAGGGKSARGGGASAAIWGGEAGSEGVKPAAGGDAVYDSVGGVSDAGEPV